MPMLLDPFIKRIHPLETYESQNTCQNAKPSHPSNIVITSSFENDVIFPSSYRVITPGNCSENLGIAR
jgi:hypothetical protein